MKVGEIIKGLRKEHRLTQAELAKRLNVAPTAVSAWERNENRPLMDKIVILADMFQIPITRFFDSTDGKTDERGFSEEEILTMAAHNAGHEGKLTEEQLAKIKIAVKIALAKDNN